MIQQLSVCNFCVAKHLYSVIAKVTPFAAMKTLKLVFRALFIALFAAQLPHAYTLRNGEHIWRPGMPAAEGVARLRTYLRDAAQRNPEGMSNSFAFSLKKLTFS